MTPSRLPTIPLRVILLAGLLAAGSLAACARFAEPEASAAQRQACRSRADEVYQRRNPNSVYSSDLYVSGQRDTPYGGTGVYDPTSPLTARYTRETLVDDCLRAVNRPAAEPATTPATPTQPATRSAPRPARP